MRWGERRASGGTDDVSSSLLKAIELDLEGRVRKCPGFEEEEQLGLEFVVVAGIGDDDGATSAAVDLGPIPSERLDEIVDRVGIAETHQMPRHDLIASSRSRLSGRSSGLRLVGPAWRISARTPGWLNSQVWSSARSS